MVYVTSKLPLLEAKCKCNLRASRGAEESGISVGGSESDVAAGMKLLKEYTKSIEVRRVKITGAQDAALFGKEKTRAGGLFARWRSDLYQATAKKVDGAILIVGEAETLAEELPGLQEIVAKADHDEELVDLAGGRAAFDAVELAAPGIQKKFNVEVRLVRKKNAVSIVGSPSGRAQAKEQLLKDVSSNSHMMTLDVISETVSQLLMNRAAKINDIQSAANIRVEIDKKTREKITVGPGAKAAVEEAAATIKAIDDKARKEAARAITARVDIEEGMAARVIGKGGSQVKTFKRQCPKVSIDVADDHVLLKGDPAQVKRLQKEISELCERDTYEYDHGEADASASPAREQAKPARNGNVAVEDKKAFPELGTA
jgi:hypothetical protein